MIIIIVVAIFVSTISMGYHHGYDEIHGPITIIIFLFFITSMVSGKWLAMMLIRRLTCALPLLYDSTLSVDCPRVGCCSPRPKP